MVVLILTVLLNFLNVSQQLKMSIFHKYGMKQIRPHDRSTEVKSLLDCASSSVASNKPFFAYPNRTCYLLASVHSNTVGDDEHGEVIYKDESHKDICSVAPDVDNGTLVSLSGLHAGAEAVYRCNEGYSLCGHSNTSTCRDTGTWTPGVNCTKSQTKWTHQDNLLIFLSCDFRLGTTFTGYVSVSGFGGKCTLAVQDRQNNILLGIDFKVFSKKVHFMSEVNKKRMSLTRRVKSSFKSGKKFQFVVQYSSVGYEVKVGGKEMPVFEHRTDTKPFLFNWYGKCHIASAQMHY